MSNFHYSDLFIIACFFIVPVFIVHGQTADSTITQADTIHKVRETTRILGATKEFDRDIISGEKFFWETYLRARHEFWNNQEDLNDDLDDLYSFYRLKLYLGIGYKPTQKTQLYGRIVNESRFYAHKGDGDSLRNDHYWRPERHYFELVLAQLYFEWKNIGDTDLSLKIGRQYLHNKGFGDQWLIGDGTPIDGSKTFYFNALKLTYDFNINSSLNLVGLYSWEDDPFIIYSDVNQTITNISDEAGGWLWWKSQLMANFDYNFFYIYKHEFGGGGYQREDISNIHSLGFHVKPESSTFWLSAQLAGQLGNYGSLKRSGLGTIIYGGYKIKKDSWSLKAGPWFMYLTGDNPESEGFEAFNNLYGGYPNDDELYLNTWARESGTSMWTNINLIGAYVEYHPKPKYNLRFWYHYMLANQRMQGDFFGRGLNRGHMIMFKCMADISWRFKAYYMIEYLWPDNYYFPSADNSLLSRINFEWYF